MIRIMNSRWDRGSFTLGELGTAHSLIDLGPLFTFRVASWSMFPTIHKGDLIEIGPADRSRVGDVVLFRGAAGLICHRVTAVGADGCFRTQGDASPGLEESIRPEEVIGTVTAIIRGGRRLSPMLVHQAPAPVRFYRAADLFAARCRARPLAWGRLWLERFRRRPAVRDAARRLLQRLVKLELGVRVPVRFLSGFQIWPLGADPVEDRVLAGLPLKLVRWEDVILLARVGPCRVAIYHAASGQVDLRGAAAGLGLEKLLCELAVRIRRLIEGSQEALPARVKAGACSDVCGRAG